MDEAVLKLLPVVTLLRDFFAFRQLRAERDSLQLQVVQQAAAIEGLEDENEDLRRILVVVTGAAFGLMIALIIVTALKAQSHT